MMADELEGATMSDHDLAVWALVMNIVGAIVTIFASLVAYTQYRRATKQLLKLRYITHSTQYKAHQSGPNVIGDNVFTVDLLSYGAAIYDLEVKFEFVIPATFDKKGKQMSSMRRLYFMLEPVNVVEPLNTGQARRFEVRRPENFTPNENCPDVFLRKLSPWLVSIVAYSGKSRKEIARFKSTHVRSKIYQYFNVYRRNLSSVWDRLDAKLFEFTFINQSGHRFRNLIEKQIPGLYDVTKHRIQRFISGRGPMERDE